MLDPQWTTLHGTVRTWLHHGRIRRRMAESSDGGVSSSVTLVFGASGPGGFAPPEETETVVRFWLERDGRSRFETVADDGHIQHIAIDDGRSVLLVPEHGPVMRVERNQYSQGTWIGDPRTLIANVRLRFGHDETVAGRAAVRVEPLPAAEHGDTLRGVDPVARSVMTAGGGYALVDVVSGLLLRYEAQDADGRPISRHEFVTLEVDEPIPDDVFGYDVPPERRERTATDMQLEMLGRDGVDVSGLDREDPVAVREATDGHLRAVREGRGPQSSVGPMVGRGARSLAETVAPLGPPPDDPDAARAEIEAVLARASDDDAPKADTVERGAVLDRAAEGRPRPPSHPIVGDQTVEFALVDLVFLREDEALIDFESRLSGGNRFPAKGRVVRIEGRWLLSYDSLAQLLQMGGFPVPSLLDHPDGDDDADQGPAS